VKESEEELDIEVDDLTDKILDLFQSEGNLTTGAVLARVDASRTTVLKRLDKLYHSQCVEFVDKDTSLYRLVTDPRSTAEVIDCK